MTAAPALIAHSSTRPSSDSLRGTGDDVRRIRKLAAESADDVAVRGAVGVARPVMVVGRADLGQFRCERQPWRAERRQRRRRLRRRPRTRGETAETRPPPQARRPPAAGPRNPTPNVCVVRRIVGTLHRYLSKCELSGRPLLVRGPWDPADVRASWRSEPFAPGQEETEEADRLLEALRRRGSPAHDGLAARLVSYSADARATVARAAARALGVAAAGPRGRVRAARRSASCARPTANGSPDGGRRGWRPGRVDGRSGRAVRWRSTRTPPTRWRGN